MGLRAPPFSLRNGGIATELLVVFDQTARLSVRSGGAHVPEAGISGVRTRVAVQRFAD